MNMGEGDVYMNMRRGNVIYMNMGEGDVCMNMRRGKYSPRETVEVECSLHEHGEEGIWSK